MTMTFVLQSGSQSYEVSFYFLPNGSQHFELNIMKHSSKMVFVVFYPFPSSPSIPSTSLSLTMQVFKVFTLLLVELSSPLPLLISQNISIQLISPRC